jgi:hypothetical protein
MALKSTERRVDELEINKQDALVSGENIRTVNGESILGEGDIEILAAAVWGSITGRLADQLDLKAALDSKVNTGGNLTADMTRI